MALITIQQKKSYGSIGLDNFEFGDGIKWTLGASAYVIFGGGGSVSINISEIGNLLYRGIEKVLSCDSQK